MTTIDRTFCALCGSSVTGTDLHHFEWRSHGGSDDDSNLIPLDRRCHELIHRQGAQLGRTPDYLFLLDNTGEIIVQRWIPPADWDQGVFVAELEQAIRESASAPASF